MNHRPVADLVRLIQVQRLQVRTAGNESVKVVLVERLLLGRHLDRLQSQNLQRNKRLLSQGPDHGLVKRRPSPVTVQIPQSSTLCRNLGQNRPTSRMAPPKTLIIRIRDRTLAYYHFLDIIKVLPSMMLKCIRKPVELSTSPDLGPFPQEGQSDFCKSPVDTTDLGECVLDEIVDSVLGDGFDSCAGSGGVWAMDGRELVGALGGWGLCLVTTFPEMLEDEEKNVGTARENVQSRCPSLFWLLLLLLLLLMVPLTFAPRTPTLTP